MISVTSECCSVSSEHHWITWPSCIKNIYNKSLKLPANKDNLCITTESETTGIRWSVHLKSKQKNAPVFLCDQRAVVFNNTAKVYTFKLVTYNLVVCCTSAQTLLLVQTQIYRYVCTGVYHVHISVYVQIFCDSVYTVAIFDLLKLILWKYVHQF